MSIYTVYQDARYSASAYCYICVLTYVNICGGTGATLRMLSLALTVTLLFTAAPVSSRTLTYADVCPRMLTYADVCFGCCRWR